MQSSSQTSLYSCSGKFWHISTVYQTSVNKTITGNCHENITHVLWHFCVSCFIKFLLIHVISLQILYSILLVCFCWTKLTENCARIFQSGCTFAINFFINWSTQSCHHMLSAKACLNIYRNWPLEYLKIVYQWLQQFFYVSGLARSSWENTCLYHSEPLRQSGNCFLPVEFDNLIPCLLYFNSFGITVKVFGVWETLRNGYYLNQWFSNCGSWPPKRSWAFFWGSWRAQLDVQYIQLAGMGLNVHSCFKIHD